MSPLFNSHPCPTMQEERGKAARMSDSDDDMPIAALAKIKASGG